VPPVFRTTAPGGYSKPVASAVSITTLRLDGTEQGFAFAERGAYLESVEHIPEPHSFKAIVGLPDGDHTIEFAEHEDRHEANGTTYRDHNIRSAYVHVIADAAVSLLAIVGLVLARIFGWVWMDPLAGIIGALVIANWSYGLMRDTGSVLLDMSPDQLMTENVRQVIEDAGDQVLDLHIWRVGPGHMSAVVSVATSESRRDSRFYHAALRRFKDLSHLTVEVNPREALA
jgi:cation diffusion facilitator family transporter